MYNCLKQIFWNTLYFPFSKPMDNTRRAMKKSAFIPGKLERKMSEAPYLEFNLYTQ